MLMLLMLLPLLLLLCVAQCDTNPARCAICSGQPCELKCQSTHACCLQPTLGLKLAAATTYLPCRHHLCCNTSLAITASAAAAASSAATVTRHQKSYLFGLKLEFDIIFIDVFKFSP